MEEGLREILGLAGVEACLVFDNRSQPLQKMGALGMTNGQVNEVGDIVLQTLASLEASDKGAIDLDLSYANSRVLIRDLRKAVLVVICDPSVNISMLRMTVNVVTSQWGEDPDVRGYLRNHAVERQHGESIFSVREEDI